jgi:gamma-glutamyltranspeptidase/glutathione hydrolase
MLERGGNAADAVLAATTMLCISEPMSTGNDAFAIVWDGQRWSPCRPTPRRRDAATPQKAVTESAGGRVYLCAVDHAGMAVSFIQSLYFGFGSGVVVPGTGVVLHNRGACFAVSGTVVPGRRPYHTIPGMAALDRPRFRVDGDLARLEEDLWPRVVELRALGFGVVESDDRSEFGGGQAIMVEGSALLGGSDARKDGYAAGF